MQRRISLFAFSVNVVAHKITRTRNLKYSCAKTYKTLSQHIFSPDAILDHILLVSSLTAVLETVIKLQFLLLKICMFSWLYWCTTPDCA